MFAFEFSIAARRNYDEDVLHEWVFLEHARLAVQNQRHGDEMQQQSGVVMAISDNLVVVFTTTDLPQLECRNCGGQGPNSDEPEQRRGYYRCYWD